MEQKCKEKYFNEDVTRFTNKKPCCDPSLIDIPTRWGCRPQKDYRKSYKTYKKKYRRYRKRFSPRKYKKYKRQYRKKKGFRKKGRHKRKNSYDELRDNNYRDSNKKQQDCPRKKKDCRCWLCKEEGHYANECPQRYKKENNKIIRQLEYINSI
ncbi:hypothetical protein V6Z11_A04G132000 [Gossypium hirsutum]